MERLITEGRIDGVLDFTTTELADELIGGVMPGGPNRLTAASIQGVPQIVSMGALDMVNFGPKSTVPEKFRNRRLFEHNPNITLMRTSEEECRNLGKIIGEKLKEHVREAELVEVWLPLGGVSMIAVKDGPFYDEMADAALIGAVEESLKGTKIKVIRCFEDINDERFSVGAAKRLLELMSRAKAKQAL